MRESKGLALRDSTKHNRADNQDICKKKKDYSPLRKSPLRNSVTAGDLPSSRPGSTETQDIGSKAVRLNTTGTPALRFPSPTRTNIAKSNDFVFRKSPQRLKENIKKSTVSTSLSPPPFELNSVISKSPQRSFNLKKRTSSESKLNSHFLRSKESKSQDSDEAIALTDEASIMISEDSLIPKKYKTSSPQQQQQHQQHSSSRSLTSSPFSPPSIKRIPSFSREGTDSKVDADDKGKELVDDNTSKNFDSGDIIESRNKILKIRSEFNRISKRSSSSLLESNSNDEIIDILEKQKIVIESLRKDMDQILQNQELIMQKLGV